MIGDIAVAALAVSALGAAALPALAGEFEGLLVGALGDGDALRPDREPRRVHHHEHGGEAAVLLADEPGLGALALAEDHDAGRRTVDAELVLDAGAAQVVARAEASVRLDQEFRGEEQRQAARAGRRAGKPREDEMDDVLGQVVLSIGDEDLLAEQAVGPVVGALRARSHCIEVGAGLRLGQVHRAGPAAGDHRPEIDVEQVLRAVGLERADRAFGEERAQGEGHRGAVPDLGAGDVDEVRQRHAAELGRRGNPAPARLGPAAIGVGEAGRRGHGPVGVNRAHGVGGAVQRRDLLGGETPGLRDDRGDRLPVELPVELCADERRQARNRLQREQDIGDRGSIGHESSSASFGVDAPV